MKSLPIARCIAAFAGLLGLTSLVPSANAGTIYFDDFTTPGSNTGGSYVSSISGTATTTGGGTWLAGVEAGGWGQTGDGRATPTSSNFLAFTPNPALIYTVQATIDTTPLGGADPGGTSSWFALGFTSSQHHWNGVDGATIDTGHLVRFNSNQVATITYTLSGADLQAAGVQYVGWITDRPGAVNLVPSNEEIKITNFSLISGVANPTVTYDGNGSDGGTVPTDGASPYTYAATVTTLGTGTMTRAGFNFIGWNTAADGSGANYSPSATFTIYDNATLYAKWLPNTLTTLTYDGNGSTGGSVPVDSSSPYTSGATVTVLGNTGSLAKNSFSFNGWNTASDGSGTAYNPGDGFTINANTTLYASWTPGPDYVWDNSATTDGWNTTDANWSGAVWSNSAVHSALFKSVGGYVFLDPGIVAGAVNVGQASVNFPNLGFYDGDLTASSLTVQGNGINGGNYGTNPTLITDSTVAISGDAEIGRASLNISGGSFTADRIISSSASADWGRLAVSGAAVVTATNGVDGFVHTGATFAIDLNGGELRTPSIKVADREAGTNNNAWLTFNSGKLTAIGADNPDFITTYGGGQNTYVASGGAVIDTNGLNIGIQVNLLDGGAGGGLTKQGTGTLTLSGAYGYTGPTVVEAGTLSLSSATLNDAATVDVASTAVLDLPIGSTDTVSDFLIDGVSQGPGTWNAANTGGRITGGSLLVVSPDPFLAWIDQTWPALSDKTPNGDPDSDGIPNLVEYVLQGGDPSQSTTGILPAVDAAGADFVFTYYRRTAATGTNQTFEYGSDLGTWTPVAIPGGSGVTVTDQGGGIEKVEVTVSKGANTKLFGRLQVTQP